MQVEAARNEALQIIHSLSEFKLSEALNYLKLLQQLPEGQIDKFEDYVENLGWTMLASEAAEKDWE